MSYQTESLDATIVSSPASSVRATRDYLLGKYRAMIYAPLEGGREDIQAAKMEKNQAICALIEQGWEGRNACLRHKKIVKRFRDTWFPGGVCRVEGYEGLRWK